MTIKLFALFVSFLFSPFTFLLFLPFLVMYKQTTDVFYSIKWQVFTSLFIFAAVALFAIARWRGLLSDIELSRKEERPQFYFLILAIALAYLGAALSLKGFLFPLSIIAFGICVAIVAFGVVNYRIKASAHVAVASSFILTVGFLYGKWAFLGTAWIVPLLAWSRVFLKRHTPYEAFAGSLLGVSITLATLIIGVYLFRGTL